MRTYRYCHSERSRGISTKKSNRFLHALRLVGMTMFLSMPTNAQDFKDVLAETALAEGAVRYAPTNCDFEMVFPDEPYIAKRCPEGQNSCYDLTGYTYVYDVQTSVDVSVTCVPSNAESYATYSKPVIRTALQGMLRKHNVENAEINTREKNGYRVGSLLGSAKRGRQSGIYNAQLWVGQNSILTIEGRLLGPSHPQADITFGDMLSSVKKKD